MALHDKRPLPTWRDLPVTDEVPMDNANHPIQAEKYLREPLERFLAERSLKAFIGINCFVYYDLHKAPCGPDFFVVNQGTSDAQGSWVVYSEGNLFPTLIVELLSPSSEKKDRGKNMTFYAERFAAPDYVLYDTEDQRFEGYHLRDDRYVRVLPDAEGRIPCQSLPLKLGVVGKWLRWFTPEGELVLTDQEQADAERQRANAERQRADMAEARLQEVERRLRELEGR